MNDRRRHDVRRRFNRCGNGRGRRRFRNGRGSRRRFGHGRNGGGFFRGFLGGDINEYTQFDPANDNRQTFPRFQPEALRLNTRIVNVLQRFGRTRGMTSAQVALAWLLAKAPFIVPIPGTTKPAHLYENLHTLDFTLSAGDIAELERAVEAIPVIGDRYDAEQQKRVLG